MALLTDGNGTILLTVSVGIGEGAAIAAEIDGIELERPMTHQLAVSLLRRSGAKIVRVELHDACDVAFYARVVIERANGELDVEDARPSDAFAIALHAHVPIWVSQAVIKARASASLGHMQPALEPAACQCKDVSSATRLEALDEKAFGRWKV